MKEKLVRGEIWPLPAGGSADEIIAVAHEMRMDFCFFDRVPGAPGKAHSVGLTAGAVVSGPWQRWMVEVGWQEAMLQLGHESDVVYNGLSRAAELTRQDIEDWGTSGADMILLADDVAYAGGPFMSPLQLEKFLLPLYRELSERIKNIGMTAGFHTDGCVDLILPVLKKAGFEFFSLEPEGTDPIQAWKMLESAVPLFSGIPATWLLPGGFLPSREGKILRKWCSAGPLIITSACGLYHSDARASLREIYQWLDAEKELDRQEILQDLKRSLDK